MQLSLFARWAQRSQQFLQMWFQNVFLQEQLMKTLHGPCKGIVQFLLSRMEQQGFALLLSFIARFSVPRAQWPSVPNVVTPCAGGLGCRERAESPRDWGSARAGMRSSCAQPFLPEQGCFHTTDNAKANCFNQFIGKLCRFSLLKHSYDNVWGFCF